MIHPASQCKKCNKVFRATKKTCPNCNRVLSYIETKNRVTSDDGLNLSDVIIYGALLSESSSESSSDYSCSSSYSDSSSSYDSSSSCSDSSSCSCD